MMRLLDLEPQFLAVEEPGRTYRHVDTIEEADGVQFLCPKCFKANGGAVGTHSVQCWSPKVSPTETPGPGRWNLLGTGLHDLTLQAGSSSVLLTSGCRWHGFVRNGEVTGA